MKVIKAGYEIISPDLNDPKMPNHIYKQIERAGRTCYKSEDKMTDESAERFVRAIVKNGHEAMLEHVSMTVKFTVDRGISHELVRHRLASFAQESTRYCNYTSGKFGGEITVIEPVFFNSIPINEKLKIRECFRDDNFYEWDKLYEGNNYADKINQYFNWYSGCCGAENAYFTMLEWGATPQEARTVLPNSLKTEVIMTANMREWRHFLKLRAAGVTGAPHPQMLEVAVPLLNECKLKLPAIFYDIEVKGDQL